MAGGDRHGEGLEIFREPGTGEHAALRRARPRRLVAISGAKGGAGKSLLTTNLALYFATIGRKVVVVDAEPEGTNVHTLLGVPSPSPIGPVLPWDAESGAPRGELTAVDTTVPGLRLAHGGIAEPRPGERRRVSRRRLLASARKIEAEIVVVDLGAGAHRSLLDFFHEADLAVFVTLPEPTAIENTYRFIRAAFARHLLRSAPDRETRRRLVERLRAMGHAPAPLDLARRLEAAGDPLGDIVRDAMESFRLRFVLNQTRVRADLELGEAMRRAVRRRFGVYVDYPGYIDFDDTVWTCVRARRPLLVESPGTKASKSIEKIARRLLALEPASGGPRERLDVPPESHHDLLEVDRGATDEEIRRAFKRAREIFAPDALACYGLFDAPAMDALRARLEEAYDVLLDPARRRPYELSVFPPEVEPRATPRDRAGDEPKPPPPIITPDTEFTGPLLRAVRLAQGIDVGDVAQKTKIGAPYLRALEEDDFGALPAPVYVRGFTVEIAKVLRLDATHVSRTYLRRYKRWLEERERTV